MKGECWQGEETPAMHALRRIQICREVAHAVSELDKDNKGGSTLLPSSGTSRTAWALNSSSTHGRVSAIGLDIAAFQKLSAKPIKPAAHVTGLPEVHARRLNQMWVAGICQSTGRRLVDQTGFEPVTS